VSANKQRRAGAPAFPKQEPKLRLVKNPDERPRPELDPELKAIIDDMGRRSRAQRERINPRPDGKDAALPSSERGGSVSDGAIPQRGKTSRRENPVLPPSRWLGRAQAVDLSLG